MASDAKAQFLSIMSHEIRTPLNGVIGLTSLLLHDDPKPEQLENLQSLQHSADHLLGLINNILNFSKIEAGKIEFELQPFQLNTKLNPLPIFFVRKHSKIAAAGNGATEGKH